MIYGQLYRAEDQYCLIPKARFANNTLERMQGLLGSQQLPDDEGLVISPCSSIHTFAMRYTIDVVWLKKDWTILKVINNLSPWRMSACLAANMVLELPAAKADSLKLNTGMQLEWRDV